MRLTEKSVCQYCIHFHIMYIIQQEKKPVNLLFFFNVIMCENNFFKNVYIPNIFHTFFNMPQIKKKI